MDTMQQAAAAVLRRLLAAVDADEIEANTPQARAMLRRLEGAILTLGAVANRRFPEFAYATTPLR